MLNPSRAIGTETERLEAANDPAASAKWDELNFDKCKAHVERLLRKDALPRFIAGQRKKS
jgi:hypothetical protein